MCRCVSFLLVSATLVLEMVFLSGFVGQRYTFGAKSATLACLWLTGRASGSFRHYVPSGVATGRVPVNGRGVCLPVGATGW